MDTRWGLILAVTVLALFAGCAGVLSDDTSQQPVDGAEPQDAPRETPVTDAAPTATPSPTPTPKPVDPDNPYEDRVLHVSADYAPQADTSRRAELNETLAYWENNSDEYAGYPVRFEYTESSAYADIEVYFVADIEQCGLTIQLEETNTHGCAPVVESTGDAHDVEIEIDNTLISNHTTATLKHEFGHALGLEHDDEPTGVMNATAPGVPMEKTIWYSVSADSSYSNDDVEFQLDGVEQYVHDGSDGELKTDVTLKRTENRSKAFVHLELTDDRDVCGDNISCVDDNYECVTSNACVAMDEETGDFVETPYVVTTSDVKTDYIAYVFAFELHNVFYGHYYLEEFPERLRASSNEDFSELWWK